MTFIGADEALVERVARELAMEFPVAAGRRGWAIANLQHMYERTATGVEERWSVDFYGPVPDTEWMQYVGHPRTTALRMRSDIVGSIEAPTPELLIAHAKEALRLMGLGDLKAPK
jgi:hypothetical protein